MTDPASDPQKVNDPASTVTRADPAGTGSEAQANIADAPTGATATPTKLDPVSRAEAPLLQFPSLAGQTGVEVAERSADVTVGRTRKHRKIFRIFTAGLEFVEDEFDHRANFTGTRQYMISHGLRPVGDVKFVGAEKYDDKNTDLIYEVEALPAAVAVEPETANTVVSQD